VVPKKCSHILWLQHTIKIIKIVNIIFLCYSWITVGHRLVTRERAFATRATLLNSGLIEMLLYCWQISIFGVCKFSYLYACILCPILKIQFFIVILLKHELYISQDSVDTVHVRWKRLHIWMKWKCGDLKCVQKPTRGRLSLTHLPVQPLSMVRESV